MLLFLLWLRRCQIVVFLVVVYDRCELTNGSARQHHRGCRTAVLSSLTNRLDLGQTATRSLDTLRGLYRWLCLRCSTITPHWHRVIHVPCPRCRQSTILLLPLLLYNTTKIVFLLLVRGPTPALHPRLVLLTVLDRRLFPLLGRRRCSCDRLQVHIICPSSWRWLSPGRMVRNIG